MRILFDIGHPGHVHFFKNAIYALNQRGHNVLITARDKDVAIDLLKKYGIEHIVLSSMKVGKKNLYKEWLIRDYKLLNIARKFNPDLLVGILNPAVAHVAYLLRKTSVIFNDTEHASLAQNITYPFADIICTPSSFNNDLGKKQIKYNGFHDLAYLHPNYFTPNPEVLNEVNLKKEDVFIVLRFVSWGASHDSGQYGIKDKVRFVNELEKFGKVLITSEVKLAPEIEKYKVKISPEKLHDLLYYASLYVGEGGTTASESAVLGTHSILISTVAKYCGVFDELHKYGLMWTFDNEDNSIELAKELLAKPDLWNLGKDKRNDLLREKINVTDFMVWLLDSYPKSITRAQQTPSLLDKFGQVNSHENIDIIYKTMEF